MVQDLAAPVVGYLLGAIPTGALVARLYRRVDLTRVGSQRTGATNVLRTLGPGAAAMALIAWSLASGHSAAYVVFAAVVAGFIVIAHRDNIDRLRRGTERRLGERAETGR